MKNLLGVAALVGFVVLLWYGLSHLDALPRGLRFPAGEYGALLGGRGG
jgi:hypothetical protein